MNHVLTAIMKVADVTPIGIKMDCDICNSSKYVHLREGFKYLCDKCIEDMI